MVARSGYSAEEGDVYFYIRRGLDRDPGHADGSDVRRPTKTKKEKCRQKERKKEEKKKRRKVEKEREKQTSFVQVNILLSFSCRRSPPFPSPSGALLSASPPPLLLLLPFPPPKIHTPRTHLTLRLKSFARPIS